MTKTSTNFHLFLDNRSHCALYVVIYYGLVPTFVATYYLHQLIPKKLIVMHDNMQDFVDSLDLPSSQAQLLITKLERDPNLAAFLNGKDYDTAGLISLACQSAKLCLGVDSVDTTLLNQTKVNANWSVVSSARNCQKANQYDQGLKHAGLPLHALYFQNHHETYPGR